MALVMASGPMPVPQAGSPIIGVVQGKAAVVKSSKDSQQLEAADRAEGPAAPGDYVFIVV